MYFVSIYITDVNGTTLLVRNRAETLSTSKELTHVDSLRLTVFRRNLNHNMLRVHSKSELNIVCRSNMLNRDLLRNAFQYRIL